MKKQQKKQIKKPDHSPTIFRSKEIERTLEMACAAPFMPKWNTDAKGNQSFYTKTVSWKFLQERIIFSSTLRHFWSDKSFKTALNHINFIVEKLAIHQIPNLGDKYEKVAEEIGEHCCYDEQDHDAFILIKKMLDEIKASDLFCGDIDDLLVSVTLIIKCQEIYLSCQEEPEPEEKEEN